jgi:hypothetical protein
MSSLCFVERFKPGNIQTELMRLLGQRLTDQWTARSIRLPLCFDALRSLVGSRVVHDTQAIAARVLGAHRLDGPVVQLKETSNDQIKRQTALPRHLLTRHR